MLGRKPKPRSYRVLIVEHGAKPGPLARKRSQVILQEVQPEHWRMVKNTTGKVVKIPVVIKHETTT